MNKLKDLWKDHKGTILGLSVVFCLFLLRFTLGLPCPIQYLTGISCPGCGMTRALWSLVTLDPDSAWHYHPAVFALIPATVLWIILRFKGMKKAAISILIGFISLMILTYFWRLLWGDEDVVTLSPQTGLIARLLGNLLPR